MTHLVKHLSSCLQSPLHLSTCPEWQLLREGVALRLSSLHTALTPPLHLVGGENNCRSDQQLLKTVEAVSPRVSQGSFFQEQMSSPVRRTAWSWRLPPFPTRPDCHWQKLLRDWSAWWLMVKPSWRSRDTEQRWVSSVISNQGKVFLAEAVVWNNSPGPVPEVTSWPPRCLYLSRWCHLWKDWKPKKMIKVHTTTVTSHMHPIYLFSD